MIASTNGARGRSTASAPVAWLWMTVPIAVLALAASLAGIFFDSVYARETENWAAQGVGQDIANLIAFPALLLFAWRAGRGSIRAYLGWLGVLVYSVYNFVIYAFDVRFNALFLVYVAVLGMSIYALIGGLAAIDARRLRGAFGPRTPVRSTAVVLIVIGACSYGLWLAGDLPAIIGGTVPPEVLDADVPTNPVHVLDMAVLLPAVLAAGILLTKRRPWGYLLAPVLLSGLTLIAIGIASLMLVMDARGIPDASVGLGAAFAVIAVVQFALVLRFTRDLDPALRVDDVVAGRSGAIGDEDRSRPVLTP